MVQNFGQIIIQGTKYNYCNAMKRFDFWHHSLEIHFDSLAL